MWHVYSVYSSLVFPNKHRIRYWKISLKTKGVCNRTLRRSSFEKVISPLKDAKCYDLKVTETDMPKEWVEIKDVPLWWKEWLWKELQGNWQQNSAKM